VGSLTTVEKQAASAEGESLTQEATDWREKLLLFWNEIMHKVTPRAGRGEAC